MTSTIAMSSWAVEDASAWVARDRRIRYDELLDGDAPRPARLTIARVDEAAALAAGLRRERGISVETGPLLLVGGGPTGRFGLSTGGRELTQVLGPLLLQAHDIAVEEGRRAVLTFVPPWVVEGVEVVFGASLHRTPQAVRSWLDIRGSTWDGFLEGLERKQRQTWLRDVRDEQSLGLTTSWAPPGSGDLDDAAPFLSAVAGANGTPQPARLSRLVLDLWLGTPGEHLLGRSRRGTTDVGFTFCRRLGDVLDVYAVGLDPELWPGDPSRRELYHCAAYLAPVRLALRTGIRHVDFGLDHPGPKHFRGCWAEQLWSIQ